MQWQAFEFPLDTSIQFLPVQATLNTLNNALDQMMRYFRYKILVTCKREKQNSDQNHSSAVLTKELRPVHFERNIHIFDVNR